MNFSEMVRQHARQSKLNHHNNNKFSRLSEIINQPNNRSVRFSMNLKSFDQKNILHKNKLSSQSTNQDYKKIINIYEQIKLIYFKLVQMYKTNQHKLIDSLIKHIKMEYYIFSKQIIEMIRNFKSGKENLSIYTHVQPKKIYNELNKFKEFLQSLYQKKCIKQIQIIQDSILSRELTIRDQTPFQRYKRITKSFRPYVISNKIDIVEEMKQISEENGGFAELNRVENTLFKRLKQTEQKISLIFHSVCNSKERNEFQSSVSFN